MVVTRNFAQVEEEPIIVDPPEVCQVQEGKKSKLSNRKVSFLLNMYDFF